MKKFFLSLIFGIFAFTLFSSAVPVISEPSFCCEMSLGGGVCLNLPSAQCDPESQKASTSCESTSFCKLGTCYDSKEGVCMENVPQKVCTKEGGTWSEKGVAELPVCQLGCCIISDQAAFVSLVRCKKLSTHFGIEMNYQSSVASEPECIALANGQDMGACVSYDASGVNTCKFTTRKDCGALDGVIALNVEKSILEQETGTKFFKDVLCSAEELNTDCARQVKTGCYNGMVYWFDSQGNRENVYSSDRDASWNNGRVAKPDEICSPTGGSKDCGNCDYLLGSTCSEWSGILGLGKPKFGDYFCKATTCTDREGKVRKNGESWCVYDIEPGKGYELVGSRHFRQICVDGEVVTDPCEDFRNDICVHSGISTSKGEFSTAACRKNRWQDCSSQSLKRDCENIDVRDCIWVEKPQGMNFNTGGAGNGGMSNPTAQQSLTNPTASGGSSFDQGMNTLQQGTGLMNSIATAKAISNFVSSGKGQWEVDFDLLNKVGKFNKTSEEGDGLCVPLIPPGTPFWEGDNSCSVASATCEVNITKTKKMDILGKTTTKYEMEPNECLREVDGETNVYEPIMGWANKVNAICTSMGDCGANENINHQYTDFGYLWKYNNDTFSLQGKINKGLSSLTTGKVIAENEDKIIINGDIKLGENTYVLIKK